MKNQIIVFMRHLQIYPIIIYVFIIYFYNSICTQTDFDYQLKKRLNNGNYLIMSTQGIYLYNDQFNSRKDIKIFDSRLVNGNGEIYSADIAQFLPEDNGYIICLLLNETYILSKNGEYQTHFTLDYTKKRQGYKIIPYRNDGNNHYYFAILYILENGNIINIKKYIYDSASNSIEYGGYSSLSIPISAKEYIACELMKYLNEKVIFCFYGEWNSLYYVVLETTDFTPITNHTGRIPIDNNIGGQLFVSNVNSSSRENIAFCAQQDRNMRCYGYNIKNNEFIGPGIITNDGCDIEPIDMRVEYFPETDEFLFGCKNGGNGNLYSIGTLSSKNIFTIYEQTEIVPSSSCTDVNIFHFTYYQGHYSILTDSPSCQNNRIVTVDYINSPQIREYPTNEVGITFTPTCDGYTAYDTSECYSDIPDKYFYNNSQKIIYKCHDNCKTCEEEGTNDNNKCLTCPSEGKKYLDSGNCVSTCTSGGYFTYSEDPLILSCKCTNPKCLYCTPESLANNNYCIICNNDGGYYSIQDDTTTVDSFINCYKNPTGYYLDTNIYKPCYSTCVNCDGFGNESNNNCNECDNEHLLLTDFNKKNCYTKCTNYYYFDKDDSYKYKCTENNNCPTGYKLIYSTTKCIDNCNNAGIYKYEYNNICYERCPSGTYYSYDHTQCLGSVPTGYYCNNTNAQTIDACHSNCQTCEDGGTDENNNCKTCPSEGTKYFDFGNCKETCDNGIHTDNSILKCNCRYNISCEKCENNNGEYLCETCNNGKGYYQKNLEESINGFVNCYHNLEGYYLVNNKYYECYISCKNCAETGNESDNKCIECKDDYEIKNDDENDKNCYKKCTYKYYYDSNNKYTCTTDDNCPTDLPKLISEKNRCIDECKKDNLYKYEYNGVCLSGCPNGTHSKTDNEYICEGDLNCEQKGKYYNYFFTACTDEVEDGYYCNNILLKTVDRCHGNCKTCLQGPTESNNTCKTCKDEGTKYFDFGNCKEENDCINGIFIDDTILKCKCSYNISCEKCEEESDGVFSCKTCNNEKGYYQKSDDGRNDGFVNCYNNLTGYYLDSENKIYKPCYISCKNCIGTGTEEDNQCTDCKEGYEVKRDFEDDNNCYKTCDFKYYYDFNRKYKCTENDDCPSEFSKLIPEKNRCVDNCSKYNLNDFNNECRSECPSGYYSKNNICIEYLKCETKHKYYNYNQTDCIDNIPDGYYSNSTTNSTIDKCHNNCKTCEEGGNDEINKCTSCKDEGTKYYYLGNCKTVCPYYYYYNNSNYYCTFNETCPEEFKFLIKDNKRCIDDCSKDDNYKYTYENICQQSCPENTKKSNDKEYLCEPCENGECGMKPISDKINNIMETITNEDEYYEETENHTIKIYSNNKCSEDCPVDFSDCYKEIKVDNHLDEDDEIYVAQVYDKIKNFSAYSFYDENKTKLNSSSCEDKNITENVYIGQKIYDEIDGDKEKWIMNLIDQGINVFNMSDEFYRDICYHYKSPNGKDVPLKARLSAFFPNITLCESGCENIGVDIQTMKAKCECKFIDIVNMDKIGDNVYTQAIQEIFDIISELNIAVVKCFKDIFNVKYFVKNTGGFIIISLFVGQLICFIKYAIDGLYYIRKYMLDLTESYIDYIGLNNLKPKNMPPKRKRGKRKSTFDIKNNVSIQSKNPLNNSNSFSKKKIIDSSEKSSSNINNPKKIIFSNKPPRKSAAQIYKNNKIRLGAHLPTHESKKNNKGIDMKEYLSVSFDENDFDDVIDKETRTFCTYFCEKFQVNQIFINSFYIKEPLRPRSLKILVLIMNIELYFVINAIFYNEDYLSDLFNSTEEEKFYSFIPRRLNEFIYTSAASGIISYFVGYVFVEEDKIKKVFRRNKEGDIKMKYEISLIIKDIENKFTTIIIISLLLTVICFVYISCFNNVYPYIKIEWIKSSLFILFLMQIINLLMTLLECIFRYSAIRCNSEKVFKLSQLFTL